MSLESDLFALLTGLVGGRVFPDVAPLSTAKPYITYQQIGGKVINYTSGDIPDKQHAWMQVNVWANTRSQANAIARQVEDAFRTAAAFSAQPESAFIATHEPDLNLYGTTQDFSIWASR